MENHRKVAEAPKIQRGPMSGASAIHHRWVSPDAFVNRAPHLRQMYALCLAGRQP